MAGSNYRLAKMTSTLNLGVNIGFGQVQLGFGAEVERVGRSGEILYAAQVGESPMNTIKSLEVVQNLHDLNLVEKMHMDVGLVKKVTNGVKGIEFKAGYITSPGQVTQISCFNVNLNDNEAIIASLFLCIMHTLGKDSAVRCIKSFLKKLAGEDSSGSRTLNGAWLEKYLEKFGQSVHLSAVVRQFEKIVGDYDQKHLHGLNWNERYIDQVEKIVRALLEKLGPQSAKADESAPSVWWTRSRKVHKLAYLLCYMGWNIAVEPCSEDLRKLHEPNLVVKFTSEKVPGGDLIEAKLYAAGVGAPTPLEPTAEDEQGVGLLLDKDGVIHAVRALLQGQHVEESAIMEAWRLGYRIGEKWKVELVFGDTECRYKFGVSTLEPEHGSCWDAVDNILHEIDRSLTKYGPMLERNVLGAVREEYNLSNRLKNIFKNRNAFTFTTTGNLKDLEADGKLRLVVAFFLGLVYGKLEALFVATGLKNADGTWSSTPLEFRIGWMDFLGQFLYDVQAKMWDLSVNTSAQSRMHSVFSFIGMCCSSKSIYFGRQVPMMEDIVGFWTGTSLVMLAAAMQPAIDSKLGARLENYPVWLLNLSTVDGVHLQSSKWITGEKRMRDLATNDAPDRLHVEIPARLELNIYLSPNFVEGNAQLVHSMMCEGDIVYVAPVMGALVNLHGKLIECSSSVRLDSCDGTDERRQNCRGGFPIYAGEFKLGNRACHGNSCCDEEMPEVVGVVMARDSIPWRFAASCIYHNMDFIIAGSCSAESCLSCAREGKVGEKWGGYII